MFRFITLSRIAFYFLLPMRVFVFLVLAQATSELDDSFNVADPAAPVIHIENIIDAERFWPFSVAVKDPVASQLPKYPGVLVFVTEDARYVRIDFGRDGVHRLPIEQTDFIQRANQNRLTNQRKRAENLVLRYASRLVDGTTEQLRPYRYDHAVEYTAWVLFIVDPDTEEFDAMAEMYQDLRLSQESVMPMLVPTGNMKDRELLERMKRVNWPIPFVYDFLAKTYLASLLPEGGIAAPAVLVSSPEGRLVYAESWSGGSQQFRLAQAIASLRTESSGVKADNQ